MLLLFDIDGTLLLKASAEHVEALHLALAEVYGVRDSRTVRVQAAGRTDLEIARGILLDRGVSAERIDDRIDDLAVACCERFAELCPDSLADRVPPGMADLLAELDARDGVHLALLTGNLEPVARLKLARAGIGHHFPARQGGFGSDSEDRTELPAIARARAGANGVPYPREDTVVIGDTPRDVACARADGVRCFAVSSGPFRAEDLQEADAVAGSTADLRRLLLA